MKDSQGQALNVNPDFYNSDEQVRQLYPPGKVIHLVETTGKRWLPVWERQEKFAELVISTKMMKHHMPNFVQERLQEVSDKFQEYGYHNYTPSLGESYSDNDLSSDIYSFNERDIDLDVDTSTYNINYQQPNNDDDTDQEIICLQ